MSLSNFPFRSLSPLSAVIGIGLNSRRLCRRYGGHAVLIKLAVQYHLTLPTICLGVAALIFAFFFKLTNKRMDEIMAANEKKKAELGLVNDSSKTHTHL
jgi:hypothetical protein